MLYTFISTIKITLKNILFILAFSINIVLKAFYYKLNSCLKSLYLLNKFKNLLIILKFKNIAFYFFLINSLKLNNF